MGERVLFFAIGSTSAVAAGALLRWLSDSLLNRRRGNRLKAGGNYASMTALANGSKHVEGGEVAGSQSQGRPEGGISRRLVKTSEPIAGLYYFMGSGEAQENPYSADNPNGLLNMSIAENSLMLDWIEVRGEGGPVRDRGGSASLGERGLAVREKGEEGDESEEGGGEGGGRLREEMGGIVCDRTRLVSTLHGHSMRGVKGTCTLLP